MNLSSTIKSIQDIMRKDDGVDGDAQRIGQLSWMLFLKVFDQREEEWEDDAKDRGEKYKSPLPENCRWRNWAAYKDGKPQTLPGEIIAYVNNTVFPGLKEINIDGDPKDPATARARDWEWVKLDQISKAVEYGTSQKSHTIPDGIAVLRMGNINNGQIDYTNLKYVDEDIKDLPRLYLKKFDLIFNRTNSYELVGKMAIYEKDDDEFTFASYLIKVAVFVNLINPYYVNIYFQSSLCRRLQIEPNITVQTNQANFNGTKLRNVLIPLPSFEEQKRIVAKVKSLMAICDTLETQLTKSRSISEKLAQSAVNAITGTQT